MDRGDGRLRRRKRLHQRLGLKSIVCCGSAWGFGTSAMTAQAENEDDNDNNVNDYNESNENDVVESVHQQMDVIDVTVNPPDANSDPECPRMNLAAALAAERQFRSGGVTGDDLNNNDDDVFMTSTEATMPLRISLMRLLEETEKEMDDDEKEELGKDQMCCVCMGRKKGAALIPCGHTFCRVCCRELWLNRGSCPLCNRSILEILDIY